MRNETGKGTVVIYLPNGEKVTHKGEITLTDLRVDVIETEGYSSDKAFSLPAQWCVITWGK